MFLGRTHVHFEVTLPSGATHRFNLNFEGDPKLNGKQAGERWDRIRPVERGAEQADAVGRVKRVLGSLRTRVYAKRL